MGGYEEALARIDQEAKDKTGRLDLSGLDLTRLPAEIAALGSVGIHKRVVM